MLGDHDTRIIDEACDRFGLGARLNEPRLLHGGVNRLWKVHTSGGNFAIHELRGTASHLAAVGRWQRIFDLEVAAASAKIPVARPVPEPTSGAGAIQVDSTPDLITVHEWVDAVPVTDPPTTSFLASLGRSLGTLHSLGLPTDPLTDDVLERRPTRSEWESLATHALADGLSWGQALLDASEGLEAAIDQLDRWDAASRAELVFSHRDLTPANTLDLDGAAVLIDWESAGPILVSSEIGRTALDHLQRSDGIDHHNLSTFLRSYRERSALPPVGEDWLTLWIRGLVVFAEHCAMSCLSGAGPASLTRLQTEVVEVTPAELGRRMALVDELLDTFESACTG